MTPVPLDTQYARAKYKWVSTSALHTARLSNGMGKAEEYLNGNAYTQGKKVITSVKKVKRREKIRNMNKRKDVRLKEEMVFFPQYYISNYLSKMTKYMFYEQP